MKPGDIELLKQIAEFEDSTDRLFSAFAAVATDLAIGLPSKTNS